MAINTLFYVHDPMCSWCWGFEPVRKQLFDALADEIEVSRLLAGLASDTDQPMPDEIRKYVQNSWRAIQDKLPDTVFNFDFWSSCEPRRATYPACRAVIAARKQGAEFDEKMTRAIQLAYYTQARNPSENETLLALAEELGLDGAEFSRQLDSVETQQQLSAEITQARQMNVDSFPGLVLRLDQSEWRIPIDYKSKTSMLDLIHLLMEYEYDCGFATIHQS